MGRPPFASDNGSAPCPHGDGRRSSDGGRPTISLAQWTEIGRRFQLSAQQVLIARMIREKDLSNEAIGMRLRAEMAAGGGGGGGRRKAKTHATDGRPLTADEVRIMARKNVETQLQRMYAKLNRPQIRGTGDDEGPEVRSRTGLLDRIWVEYWRMREEETEYCQYYARMHEPKATDSVVGTDFILDLQKALSELQIRSEGLFRKYGNRPLDGSVARAEEQSSSRPESIASACSLAVLLLEYGGEHLSVLNKVIHEPIEPLVTWTCVRSMLESCAVIVWITDPTIDSQTRIGRVFAQRFEGLMQQLKAANSANASPPEIVKIKDRIDAVETDALAAGFQP